jgi:regulator of protease activity HflC (stomatin/prohibitin superfamily)
MELLGNIDRMDSEAEVIEAAGEAEAEVIEAEAELVEAEAEAESEVIETEAEAEEEVTPGSRRGHWYFRPRHEWDRD